MASMNDILDNKDQVSIGNKPKSMNDLLEENSKPITPSVEVNLPTIVKTPDSFAQDVYGSMPQLGLDPISQGMFAQPESGWNEFGVPIEKGKRILPKVNKPEEYAQLKNEKNVLSRGKERSYVQELWDSIIDPFDQGVARAKILMEQANKLGVNPSTLDPSLGKSIEGGWGAGVIGLMRSKGKSLDDISNEAIELMPTYKRIAYKTASLASDFPAMVVGGALGAKGGPITVMGGAFALPAAIRQAYVDHLERGEITSFTDFWQRLLNSINEAGKGYLTGAATGAAGIGSAGIAKLGKEYATMTLIGAALEGKVPEPKDWIDNAILLGGLHAAGAVSKNMMRLYKDTGILPEDIVKEAKVDSKIAEELKSEDSTLEYSLKKAKEKVEEINKVQYELNLKEMATKIPFDQMIKEDLGIKGRRIEQIKQSNKYVADEVINRAMEKLPDEEFVTIKKPLKEDVTFIGMQEGINGESFPLVNDKNKSTITYDPEKHNIVNKEDFVKESHGIEMEPITDIDLLTGTREPLELSTERSPFRESAERTLQMKEMYEANADKINKDVEMATSKLINDVNRWLDGDKTIPIDEVRDQLSMFASRGEELKGLFTNKYKFDTWKKTVEEAAKWARNSDRLKIERTDTMTVDGNTLNMFVDPTKVPELIKGIYSSLENKLNAKDLWKQTGFYFNPYDKKWRFEIDDSKFKIREEFDRLVNKDVFGPNHSNVLINIIDYPQLFKAYPEAANIKVKRQSKLFDIFGSTQGWFDSVSNTLNITPYAKNVKATMIHEIQHWIQFKEGWAQGGNIATAIDKAGEDFLRNSANKIVTKLEKSIELYNNRISKINKLNDILDNMSDADLFYLSDKLDRWSTIFKELESNASKYRKANPGKNYFNTEEGKNLSREKYEIVEDLVKILDISSGDIIEMAFKFKNHKTIRLDSELNEYRNKVIKQTDEKNSITTASDTEALRDAIKKTGKVDFDAYSVLAGEIEARDTVNRMNMTIEERRQKLPLTSEEFRSKDVIVHFGDRLKNEQSGIKLTMEIDPKDIKKSVKDVIIDDSLLIRDKGGTSLYSGIPIDEASKAIIELARKGAEGVRKAKKMKEFNIKEASKFLRRNLTTSFSERSGNTRRELSKTDAGYYVMSNMYMARGGHPKALQVFGQMRREVDSGLSRAEIDIKDSLIKFIRILDIAKYKSAKQFSFPEDSTPEIAAAYVNLFKYKKANGIRDLTPNEAYRLYHINEDGSIGGRVGVYFDTMKRAVKDLYEEGMITEQEYNDLTKHNYRKIRLVDIFDNEHSVKLGGKKITVYDSGIERLAKGKKTDIYEPDSNIVGLETLNTIYSRIYKNRANKELYELALNDKENPFARVKESKKDKIPEDFRNHYVKVYLDGEKKTIFLSNNIGPEWITSNAQTTFKYAQFLRYASASPLVKTFATGINQAFALRNLPRDALQVWFTARVLRPEPSKIFGRFESVYSPTIPAAMYQMGKHYRKVFMDAALKKGSYIDYIDDGGGMELLTPQGRLLFHGKHLEKSTETFYKYAGYLGTTSELLSRLAIRDKVINTRAREKGKTFEEENKDKKSRKEATFAARDYMDFSQGGDIIKAMDNAIPYLSAKIVAMRGFLRAWKDQPVVSAYKLTQFAALVTGLYIGNQLIHPQTMKELEGDRRTTGNLVFPLGDMFGFKDEMGNNRYPFIVIPINQEMAFFKALSEAGIDFATGKEVNIDRIVQSFKSISPADVTSLPPTVSGALGYTMNKDFWRGKDIVPEGKGPFKWPNSKHEWDKNTSQAAIDLGKATGLSPKRLEYLMGQLITNDNMYAQILGKAYKEAFGQLPQKHRDFILTEALSKVPIIKAFFKLTNPYSKYADSIQEARDKATIDRAIENNFLDMQVDAYLHGGKVNRSEIENYMRSFKDKKTYDRLKDRFEFQEKTAKLPNHEFWLGLKSIDDIEARAKEYVKWAEKDPESIIVGYNYIKNRGGLGIITGDFIKAVEKVKSTPRP